MLYNREQNLKEQPKDKNGWPLKFDFVTSPPQAIAIPLATIGIAAFAFLLFIAAFAIGSLVVDFVSGDQHRVSDAAKTALPILAAAIGLPLLVWRLLILDRQTRISEDKTQIDRETHYTSIFSRSIDQLGQTREVKRTNKTESGSTETTTTTVPNIEIRLGGIHSLARLAEESRKDRLKIESTLLAYIRENSWINRDGEKFSRLIIPHTSSARWGPQYRNGAVSKESIEAYKAWAKNVDTTIGQANEWRDSIAETRVDVNEAIDAVGDIEHPKQRIHPRNFFECLFVGRQFYDGVVSLSKFERCSFVNCTLSAAKIPLAEFHDCLFINCTIQLLESEFRFRDCTIFDSFLTMDDGKAAFLRCKAINLGNDHVGNSTLRIVEGFSRTLWFASDQLRISAQRTTFSECNFDGMQFSDGSEMLSCAFPECSFDEADLGNVTLSSTESIGLASASKNTILPKGVIRPEGWPRH